MPPRVTIHVNSSLDDIYKAAQARVNTRFHNYELQCPKWGETEEQAGNRQTYQAYAQHASDHLPVGFNPDRDVV